jgi:predicted transcriptional regulator of viral defense system
MIASDAVDQLLPRIVGEYQEMPGLRLTVRQAQRLWALDQGTTRGVLQTLEDQGFLSRLRDGSYVRRDTGRYWIPRPFPEEW